MEKTNDNLIELVSQIVEVPHELAEDLRTLPQIPDQWLDKLRMMLRDDPSSWSVIRKVKFTRAFIKCIDRMRKMPGMPVTEQVSRLRRENADFARGKIGRQANWEVGDHARNP